MVACVACICKCTIGIINALFLLVGLLVTAVGGILIAIIYNADVASYIEQIIEDIVDGINSITTGGGINADSLNFVALLQPAAFGIFFTGIAILGIAVIGYCGLSCYEIVLKVYLVIIIAILAAQVIIVIVFFTGRFDDQLRAQITVVIEDHYVDFDDPSVYSVVPNIIMTYFQCCGLDGWEDFNNSNHWNATREIRVDPDTPAEIYTLQTPLVCCANNATFPEVNFANHLCAVYPNYETSNYEKGCWDEVGSYLADYKTYAILVASAVLLIQAAIVVGVLIIICNN